MAEYRNVAHYNDTAFEWDPAARVFSGGIAETSPGYLPMLLQYRDMVRAGTAKDYEAEQYRAWEQAARAIPTRDIAALTSGWQGDVQGQWTDNGWQGPTEGWWDRLDPMSPDVGPIVLGIRDKMDAGTATPQERQLFAGVMGMASDWDWRASTPQASDAFNPLGDNLFGALGTLALGATGGLAAAPLAAGGAGLTTTLGSLGTLAGVAGTGAGVLGQATDQDWLRTAGLALGAAGGVAGGVGGLSSLWGTGVQSLSDAAKLAQSAGKITGAAGRASGNEALGQASRYLGYAGQAGNLGSGVLPTSATDWSTQRSSPVEWDYSNDWGASAPYDDWSNTGLGYMSTPDMYDAPIGPGLGWDAGGYPTGGVASLSLEDQVRQAIAGRPDLYGSAASPGGTSSLWGTLASLGSGALKLLMGGGGAGGAGGVLGGGGAGLLGGGGAGLLGPLLSTLGSVGGGAIGANASNDAARLQADALNRGIDLQTAQWLRQQENQAPWMEAGRGALGELTWRQSQEQSPALPGATAAISGANYALPSATPGWSPQTYAGYTPLGVPQASQYGYQGPQVPNAGDYRWTPGQGPRAGDYRYTPGAIPSAAANRWTPGQGPSAADYRYTPGQTPDAAQYQSGPPQLFAGAMPGTQVSTLTGQQVLDQDPGAAFRQSEARKALEASALARGTGMSGATLSALMRQSQDLASQEYGNAWQRMMARDTEQYGRNWGQYQQAWNQGVTGTQLGLQTHAQNFGQAMSAAQLREQVQQVATQQGWSQAQAEAAFREQMAQQASQQGFGQQMSEAQMREQVNQVATQQGWSQAQAEAAFREQMAQQASQQGFGQALGAQGQQWQQGMAGQQFDWTRAMEEARQREQGQQFGWGANLQAQQLGQRERQQYETDLYNRMMGQSTLRYGQDVNQDQINYQRQQQAYQQQIAEMTRQWNQAAGLAGVGQTAVGQVGTQGQTNANQVTSLLGQLGTAQGLGELGPALAWQRALGGATNNATSFLAGLNR